MSETMQKIYKYLIIGNSAAGIGAVEGIRRIDAEGSLALISSENHHTYSRPLISYLLEGKTDRERMLYRGKTFYEENHCDVFFGKTAVSVDADAHLVTLDDGAVLQYEKLMYAGGSSPFVPPFQGLNTVEKKFSFMTLDDALSLEQELAPDKNVLIMGAGLIGLKCCEGIAQRVKTVTVVDLSTKILSSILTEDAAALVQRHLEAHGIRFRLGQSVKEFSGNTAVLDSGETLSFDILVLAVGVRPRTALLQEAGCAVGRGILTDSAQHTNLPDVYAAGDCTESYDISADQNRILALLPNAYRQGETAGANMAGGAECFDKAIPMNAIGFFGLHILTAGSYTGETVEKTDDRNYKVLYHKNNLLKGYIMIGNVDKAGIYTSLIRDKIPLDTIDFELICEKPGLMAFSQKYRSQKLGGLKQ